jgi:phosphotransferase system  glucose/maltose/N-acetylglucosamine-specific IIC component
VIKGTVSALFAALLVAAFVLVILHFSGSLLWLAENLIIGIIFAAILLFIAIFIFAIIVFLALFYFIAEKKPEETPGEYRLDEEKGKHDE